MRPIEEQSDHRIMLQSGRLLDLANPSEHDIDITDIAQGLAQTCRFAGQCSRFYSVAEHSVLVSIATPHAQLAALFHDATEAFIGDMSKPLKRLMPQYSAVEERLQRVIFKRFHIEWPIPPEVKQADQTVMQLEQHCLMHPFVADRMSTPGPIHPSLGISCFDPTRAKSLFLARYAELTCK